MDYIAYLLAKHFEYVIAAATLYHVMICSGIIAPPHDEYLDNSLEAQEDLESERL